MTRHVLYRWKVVLITEKGVGLFTEVVGEDADAAAENAELMSGLDVVLVESIDPRWTHGMTVAERVAA